MGRSKPSVGKVASSKSKTESVAGSKKGSKTKTEKSESVAESKKDSKTKTEKSDSVTESKKALKISQAEARVA